MPNAKKAWGAFWDWKPLPEVLAGTAILLGILAIVGAGTELLGRCRDWSRGLLTGGALAYAARTYEKQRQDRQEELAERRRAQASAGTLVMNRKEAEHNGEHSRGSCRRRRYHATLSEPRGVRPQGTYGKGENLPADSTEEHIYAEFKDAANVEWRCYSDGRLVEVKLSPANTNKGRLSG